MPVRVPLPTDRSCHASSVNSASRVFLTQPELARLWRLSGRTLEKWRWTKQGPAHVKLGGRVVYRMDDVEAYEAEHRRKSVVA